MRLPCLASLLALAAGAAQALPSDVKTLAQFDLGFAKCESRFAHMKGRADEAYLGLWKVKVDAARRAELSKVRKGAAYKAESDKAKKRLAKETPAVEEKIRQQCEGTWAEAQRNRPLTAPARAPASASAPAPAPAPKK